jgi:FSR family fosmidomycin resistance protein-like MFS transporter
MTTGTLPAARSDQAQGNGFDSRQVLTLAGAHLVHDTYSAFLNPLLPLIIDKLHLSLTLAGSLTLYAHIPSLLNPFIGLWADRIDLRLLVILAPAGSAIAMSLIGMAPSYSILALLLLAAGLISAALHVPGPVIVSHASGRRTGTGMSLWMAGGELARMMGPLFAVAAVSWLTLEGYYPVMLVGILTSVVLYIRFKRISLSSHSRSRPAALGETWRALRRLMIPLAVIMLLRSLMRAALSAFLPTFVTVSGQSLWAGGTALAAVELAGALGALAAGTLSDRVDQRKVLLVAILGGPLLLLLFLAIESSGVGMVAELLVLGLTGFATLSTTPVIMAMVQEQGRDHPATANGLYMGIHFAMNALAALVLGWMGDQVGLRTAFAWSALLAMCAVPAVLFLPARSSGSTGG